MSLEMQQRIRENAQELGNFLSELNKWETDIKREDDELKKAAEIEEIIPPIRRSAGKEKKSNLPKKRNIQLKEGHSQNAQKTRISSYDYDAWAKFDVDSACKDAEEEEEEDHTESDEEEEYLEAATEAEQRRRLQQAEFEKDKGNNLFKDGKYEAAINRYTIAAELNPYSSIIVANRAMALIKLERYAAAEYDCNKALELDPGYAKAIARRATARTKLKKYQEAKEDQERLLKLQPNNSTAKMEIAKLEKLLMLEEADKKYTKCQKALKRIAIHDIGSDSEEEAVASEKIAAFSRKDEQQGQPEQLKPKEVQQIKQQQQPKEESNYVGKLAGSSGAEISLVDTISSTRIDKLHSMRPLNVPSTAVQFETEFKKLKRDYHQFYHYFKAIPSKLYRTLLHHCIDEVLPIALECFQHYYQIDENGYWEELTALAEVPRFDMAVMFLSKGSKKVAANLFEALLKKQSSKAQNIEPLIKLAKRYSVTLSDTGS